jgi:hypothetical protein
MATEANAQNVTNPEANVAAFPNFFDSGNCSGTFGNYTCDNPCLSSDLTWPIDANSPSCDAYVLDAINDARVSIGESVLALPSNWHSLSTDEQLFVLLDMERVGDGSTPVLGINTSLSLQAQIGAQESIDPVPSTSFPATNGPGGGYWGSVWAQGISPLAADYLWMYDDGWGGSTDTTSNLACTSAGAFGCWGHRDIILGAGAHMSYGVGTTCTTCEMGVGYDAVGGTGSWAALIEVASGTLPAMSFTWASEVPYFSPPMTTNTTIVTGTTTVTVIPPEPKLIKLAFSSSKISVRWTSPNTDGIHTVYLQVRRVRQGVLHSQSACDGAGAFATKSYRAASNVMSAVIVAHSKKLFVHGGYYVADVAISNSATDEVWSSPCLDLGRAS